MGRRKGLLPRSEDRCFDPPFGQSRSQEICPSYLAPVGSLLQDSKLLKLHDGARRSLLDVIAEVRKQQERGRDWWQEPR